MQTRAAPFAGLAQGIGMPDRADRLGQSTGNRSGRRRSSGELPHVRRTTNDGSVRHVRKTLFLVAATSFRFTDY